MGLFDKLKNVLFEEEEVEIPVITNKSKEEEKVIKEPKRSSYTPSYEETEEIDFSSSSRQDMSRFRNVKRDIEVDTSFDDVKTEEIPVVKEEPKEKSPFLSFDEDEFERLNSRIKDNEEKQEKEIREKEKPKKKEEKKSVEVPKRFKPSPVISPVYGILDKNYKKEDIIEKNTDNTTIIEEVSVEAVRKKAFGTLVDDIESSLGVEEVKVKEDVLDDRSIDEILTDSIDETINVDEDLEIPVINEEVKEDVSVEDLLEDVDLKDEEIEDTIEDIEEEPILQDEETSLPSFEEIKEETEEEKEDEESILEKTNTIKMLDEIVDELDDAKMNKDLLEDTTETDLFNLIDSMYENREEDK